MTKLRSRSSLYLSFMTLVLLGMMRFVTASPQQQPPPGARGLQVVDPPEPARGEGVELSVRVLDAMTGKGIPDAKLEITRSIPAPPRIIAAAPGGAAAPAPPDRRLWVYSKSTDALGAITLPNMMADAYMITATLEGYVLAKGATESITLTKGRTPPPVVFRMFKAVSIEGIVHDRDRNPVENATVDILEETWVGGLRTLLPLTITSTAPNGLRPPPVLTDKDGKFAFNNIMPGTYFLRAVPQPNMVRQQLAASPPERQAAFVTTLYPGATMLEQAAKVRVDAGGTLVGLRLEMQTSPYYAFSGKVTGIPAEVRSSGLVLIRRASYDSPFPFVWKDPYANVISVQIKPDGTFSSPSVPPGPYWAGYTPAGPVRGGSQFRIDDRNVEGFQIDVVPGISFTGRAVYEDGSPASGSGNLAVFLPTMGVYERGVFIAPTGEFNTTGLPAGPYRLVMPGSVVRKVEVDRRAFTGGEFELTPLGGNAVVTIGRGGGVIQGRVDLHEQAKTYARGMVTIARLPLEPMDTVTRRYLAGNNTFAADHLEAGRYRVCAWLEEGTDVDTVLGNPRFEQKFGIDCQAVTLSTDENRAVQLKQVSAQDFK
jgi:protocatechuate 3,4-dioxygenase beta subunit